MLPLSIQNNLNKIKSSCLIFDIECSSFYPNGKEINLKANYDDYIFYAKVKWIGFYSYKYHKQYYLNALENYQLIQNLFKEHDILIGFNSIDFDFPICKNNGLFNEFKRYINVDMWEILGTVDKKNRNGFPLKNRAELMEIDLKNNSLAHMAEKFKLDYQKGEIDYKIFQKEEWTEGEKTEIVSYLSNDIMATKGLFDKTWYFWLPFTELIDEKFIYDLSWIRNSIASLTYKAACKIINEEPTYSDKHKQSEEGGGNVLLPKFEEARNVYYCDVASLYPHIYAQFNLNAEIEETCIKNYNKIWHGNNLFTVRGYYDISAWHPLSKYLSDILKERFELKRKDKDNPKIYTYKIIGNSYYGAQRSAIFEKIHTPNAGYDCCWIGRQIQQLMIDIMDEFGFDSIAGDTDSCMFIARNKKDDNITYVKECLQEVVRIIKDNVPFPVDTFDIKLEHKLDYIMFPFSDEPIVAKEIQEQLNKNIIDGYREEIQNKKKIIIRNKDNKIIKIGRSWVKERVGKKKNYLMIYTENDETKVEIIGLPIKKDNATPLGYKIYKEKLEPEILKHKSAKFSKKYIDSLISLYLKNKEIMSLLAIEYKVQKIDTYKEYQDCSDKSQYKPKQLQAQISHYYLNDQDGRIKLIKNNLLGRVGIGSKYCTIEEALENNLGINDLDLEKVYNELNPFIQT